MAYIRKIRRRWYAVLHVPPDVQKHFGKLKFKQSLKTESKTQAQRLVGPVVAHWKELIRKARGQDEIAAEAMIWRDLLKKAKDDQGAQQIKDLVKDRVDDIWQAEAPKELLNPAEAREASPTWPDAWRLWTLSTGQVIEIEPLVEPWLAEAQTTRKTKDMHRSAMQLLIKHHPTAQEVNRRTASEFVRSVLTAGRNPATVNRMISSYSGFWRWLVDRGELPEDARSPWERQRLPTNAQGIGRQAFSEDEARAYIELVARGSNKHPDDLALVRLQAVTGMRADEAAQLKPEDVQLDGQEVAWIRVRVSKTKAGKRMIPVIDATVITDLRVRLGNNEWLFEHLKGDRYGNKAQIVSKRLNRLLDKINSAPTLVANHSWRHRARTRLEHAGISPWVADWFVGHERQGEGLKRYSQGPSQEQLIKAAKAIPLP